MVDFVDKYIHDLIAREGGYSNHSSDKGGATMYGITEQVARAYGYTGPMQNLPRLKAEQIYKAQYWMEPGFHAVHAVIPDVAEELFDTGVNMGPKRAAKML